MGLPAEVEEAFIAAEVWRLMKTLVSEEIVNLQKPKKLLIYCL